MHDRRFSSLRALADFLAPYPGALEAIPTPSCSAEELIACAEWYVHDGFGTPCWSDGTCTVLWDRESGTWEELDQFLHDRRTRARGEG